MIDALATNLVFLPLHFSRNRLDVVIDPADTTLTDRSSLRYALTLLVPTFPQSSEFTKLTTLIGRERPPQISGGLERFDGAQFRIDEVLDGFLETQKPAFNQTAMSIVPTMTMPYCLRETVTGGKPAVSTELTRPKEWIFKGGLTNEDFAGWADRFFNTYLRDTRQFLTWQPLAKSVSLYQPEYLYFLLNCSPVPAIIKRRIQVTYPDGRSDVRTLDTLSGASLNQVVCVPAGMYPNGLGYDVASYDVWLSDGNDNRISQVRTFRVDSREQEQERFILFENSLGGFDTLRITGQATEATSVRRVSVEIDETASTAIDVAQVRIIQAEGDHSLSVSTGYFTRQASAWARYMDELLFSKAIYLVTDKGQVPLLLTTSELLTHEDNADLIARTLSFKKAKVEQNFSLLPISSAQAGRPTAWRGIGFRQVLDSYGKRTGLGAPIRLRKYYTDDGTDVKPITEKPNAVGNADFITPTPVPGVVAGSTPYGNAAISRTGRFNRSTCPSGQQGGPATISVGAGKYGGEDQADANARAEAEFASLDTQAYADANGSCAMSENYTWNVPANQFHIRFSNPAAAAIYHNDGLNGPADMGNTQSLQGQAGQFVYLAGSNDLNFPAADANWLLYSLGSPYANKRLTLYKNGVLLRTQDFTHNKDGYELLSLVGADGTGPAPASGELYYVKFEDR
ncbi:DUF5977 domain-containing protein [Spirosoma oryzicola]|uniref:DUF5977 domain-containing protein n=1 Tax=Spirosoma oryzicola TaxID=2898794 RepID=UPI001E3A94E8|nr:DUF5977 domain-containing protein [Spirosoma oryzicola]UHG90110.1 DUF5977 domain-containing protein [Spirosoma oryzicola]